MLERQPSDQRQAMAEHIYVRYKSYTTIHLMSLSCPLYLYASLCQNIVFINEWIYSTFATDDQNPATTCSPTWNLRCQLMQGI